jgi:hypothetical protein
MLNEYLLHYIWLDIENYMPILYEIKAKQIYVWESDEHAHRENDNPAMILMNGTMMWYINGKKHRDNDRPAEIRPNERKMIWYQNDKIHRNHDLPAMVTVDHTFVWYKYGDIHRDFQLPQKISYLENKYIPVSAYRRPGIFYEPSLG